MDGLACRFCLCITDGLSMSKTEDLLGLLHNLLTGLHRMVQRKGKKIERCPNKDYANWFNITGLCEIPLLNS